MARRKRMSRKKSKNNFRSGLKVKKRNRPTNPMRGGIRL